MIGRSAQPGAMLFRVVIGRWTKLLKIVKNVVAMTSAFYKLEKSARRNFDYKRYLFWTFAVRKDPVARSTNHRSILDHVFAKGPK